MTLAYTFALKWSPDLNIYNIHGLWPQNVKTEDESKFDVRLLSKNFNLFFRMMELWNSDQHKRVDAYDIIKEIEILVSADTVFWSHEWDKHGTQSKMNQNEYFGKALELYDKLTPKIPRTNMHHQLHFLLDDNFEVIQQRTIE